MKQVFQGKNFSLFLGDKEITGLMNWSFTTNIPWYKVLILQIGKLFNKTKLKIRKKGERMIYKLFKKYIDREVDRRVCNRTELDFLKSMRKLDVEDGDILIVEHPYVLKKETHWNLKLALEKLISAYGADVKVIIIEDEMKLSASSKQYTGLSYIIDNDKDFLKWIWARLNYLHGESPDSDYMHKLLDVAEHVGFEKDVKDFIGKYMAKSGE